MVKGGMHGKGGRVWYACPLPLRDMAGQCTDGTHPTGMHSCWTIDILVLLTCWWFVGGTLVVAFGFSPEFFFWGGPMNCHFAQKGMLIGPLYPNFV